MLTSMPSSTSLPGLVAAGASSPSPSVSGTGGSGSNVQAPVGVSDPALQPASTINPLEEDGDLTLALMDTWCAAGSASGPPGYVRRIFDELNEERPDGEYVPQKKLDDLARHLRWAVEFLWGNMVGIQALSERVDRSDQEWPGLARSMKSYVDDLSMTPHLNPVFNNYIFYLGRLTSAARTLGL